MKRQFFYSLSLIFSLTSSVIAQETDSLQTKEMVVLDSLIQDEKSIVQEQIFHELEHDSIVLKILDFEPSKVVDSLWLGELTQFELLQRFKPQLLLTEPIDSIYTKVSTEELKLRLDALNERTPFDIAYHPSLERIINFYLHRDPETTQRLLNLGQFYFPMFEEVFDAYDIPLEMKYLAVVESALNPKAKSPVGATGIWQFMYGTGKMFDLEVSSYVDERMDPIKSTDAAAKYLSKLYDVFNDWDLALAAYNSGPGNVNKAIRRSGGKTNYWEIRPFLPRETAGYVPSFHAVMYLYEYAEAHGFSYDKSEYSIFTTDTVHVKSTIKLSQVAAVTKLDEEIVEFLNPSYKLGIIPDDPKRNYYLRLPQQEAGVFAANEAEIYAFTTLQIAAEKQPLPQYVKTSDVITYRVRSGDFLGKIANSYGVRVSDIKRWNNLKSDKLSIGQRLKIHPKNLSAATQVVVQEPKKKNNRSEEDMQTYVVEEGDSLWSISRKFPEITIEDIKQQNNLRSIRLQPGMELKI